MHTKPRPLNTLIVSTTLLAATVSASALTLPGIDNAEYRLEIGNTDIPPIPADFFHPGSEPFFGTVIQMQPCIADFTGGCIPIPPGPIDLFTNLQTLPQPDVIAIEMVELNLRSVQPIVVGELGEVWDVFVDLTPLPPVPGDPINLLPPGNFNVDSFFDIEYRIDFVNPDTGQPADGGPLIGQLPLISPPMPWFHDPAEGLLIPGFDGVTLNPFEFVSPDGGLAIGGTSIILPPLLEGDLNNDGFVGIEDLNIVLSNWNQPVPAGSYPDGDPSGDGFVGIEDLNVVLGNWNASAPPATDASIPEPMTAGMIAVMAGCHVSTRRTKLLGRCAAM